MATITRVPAKTDQEMTEKSLGVSSSVTVIPAPKVSKAEQAVLLQSVVLDQDDFFPEHLFDASKNNPLLSTPFPFRTLEFFCQLNNALAQLIVAYEVNIDGTGWVLERETSEEAAAGEKPPEDTTLQGFVDFFEEVWPGLSFTALRKRLRKDREKTGNAYMEVVRSVTGKITFLRRLDPKHVRMVRLDEAVQVKKVVTRFGDEHTVTMPVRERRFVQAHDAQKLLAVTTPNRTMEPGQGNGLLYFREFGSSRELNKFTGDWLDSVPAEKRATEVIHFKADDDVISPYGVPRWINQIPSIIGSRKAEELNLQFFQAGGIPPIMVLVAGGEMTGPTRDNLQQYLANSKANKHQAAIVEVHGTGGGLDSTNNVRVTVERFGAEKQKDSLFENYDEKSERRVRSSFRLPPIFVGRTEDYSFATAFASYVVAENQVFKPERQEFDEVINSTILRELNVEHNADGVRIIFRSLALTTVDIKDQMAALTLAKDFASRETLVAEVNEKFDLALEASDTPPGASAGGQPGQPNPRPSAGDNPPDPQPEPPEPGGPTSAKVQKIDPMELLTLASEWTELVTEGREDGAAVKALRERVITLSHEDRRVFDHYVCEKLYQGPPPVAEADATSLLAKAGNLVTCDHADHAE